ncbi:hypothetical protein BJ875DRAFT_499390 [Amylocarpus encephaloides]|uniref:Fe2OG dioxygenase domain-containing protein n=1 Tax=Amylocarpus encephaloides TaxID=45428 RepID=A0A9P7YBU4_9HELO|nr:hypothetical protein BJ875DRAFT_499390 [Amylocarpus encephaloides]
MAATTKAVDSDSLVIPLVDFSQFQTGTPEQRSSTAKSILHGFQTAGFIYLTNIPIPPATITHAFTTSSNFFSRPQSCKESLGWTTPESNRGYVSHGREKVSTLLTKDAVAASRTQAPDLKESFEIGREGEAELPNNWPADSAGEEFRKVMLEFHDVCKNLYISVMRAIAVGMGLDECYFDGYTDVGDNTLRLLHYPEVKKDVFKSNKLQVRAGEHTDYGSITLLFQDDRGGLQVKSPRGTFVDAIPIPGSVVVNAGDLLARWSNDTIKSTLHRVVEPPAPEEGDVHPARYSIAYFCNPNFKSHIEAIPGTYGEEKDKKYAGINSGEYLVQRLAATY